MTLQPGQKLAHYVVVEKIGSGGMGEVWRAEDTRLKRMVALKTLPQWSRFDERLRARFEREAQAIAALNHPNIVTLYSVEDVDGLLFLTMELVEGRPLTRTLKHALPLEQFFSLAIPLADAIAAAHDREILHRDLKPDNVMVTDTGSVKVLDFGLAKLREDAIEEPAPIGSNESLTQEGKVIGTAAYMSPEQAEAKAVGPSSDVFSLGVLLYQMASGKRPFTGGTTVSLVSSILKDNPAPIDELNEDVPHHLGRIVRRCLVKDPARRYATARELRNELEFLQEELATNGRDTERTPRRRPWRMAAIGAGVLLLATIATMGWLRETGETTTAKEMQVSQQTLRVGVETHPSLSPDGQYLAYEATDGDDTDIFYQKVGAQKLFNLTEESDADDGYPAFSPDGTHIAFHSKRNDGDGIYIMGATGENVRRLTDFGFQPAWSRDGTRIAFGMEDVGTPLARDGLSDLYVVDVATGETQKIFEGDAVQPSWSPSGARIAFWTAHVGTPGLSGQRDILTVRSDGSDPKPVTLDAAVDWRPVWSPDGREILFASDRGGSMNLWRVAIDEQTGEVSGEPRPMTMPSLWSAPFSLSADGSQIAYVAKDERSSLMAYGFDPEAGVVTDEDPRLVTGGTFTIFNWEVSPDGSWIAFDNTGRQEDVYLVDRDGGKLRKLTDDLDKDRGVSWIDDEKLLFYSARGGGYEIWTIRQDGSGLQQVTEATRYSLWFPRVSPDGTRMMAHNARGTFLFDFPGRWPLRVVEARHVTGPADSDEIFRGSRWSADGKRIVGVFHDGETGRAVGFYDVETEEYERFEAPGEVESEATEWLPDGRRALARVKDSVWLLDTETGEWSDLLVKVESGPVRLTPDGRTLHVVKRNTEADIWVARIE